VRKRNGSARPNAFHCEDFEKELTASAHRRVFAYLAGGAGCCLGNLGSATSVGLGSDIPLLEHLIAALIWRDARSLRVESQGNEPYAHN
jgi:hypothetical protein